MRYFMTLITMMMCCSIILAAYRENRNQKHHKNVTPLACMAYIFVEADSPV